MPQVGWQVGDAHFYGVVRVFQQVHNAFADDFVQQFFQAAHACFPGVALNNLSDGSVGDVHLLFQQAGPFQQPRHQVMLGDSELFLGDVARQADHVHTVEQWPGDCVELVGGADEQDLGQVHAHVQVVVQEFPVLFRVQGFKQCGGRVALEGGADLVDLIQHDYRVRYLRVLQGLHKFAGHGADVGAAVALDFGFVAHAAHAESIELAAEGVGDGMADGGLAHARRAHQQEDGAADFALEGAFGKELDNSVFHVVQAIVITVQDAAGLGQIEMVLRRQAPGYLGQPVQVIAGNAVLR